MTTQSSNWLLSNLYWLLPFISSSAIAIISICVNVWQFKRGNSISKELDKYKAQKQIELWNNIVELKELTSDSDLVIDMFPLEYEYYEYFDPEFTFEDSFSKVTSSNTSRKIENIKKLLIEAKPFISKDLFNLAENYCYLTYSLIFHINLQLDRAKKSSEKSHTLSHSFERKWYEFRMLKDILESELFSKNERESFKHTFHDNSSNNKKEKIATLERTFNEKIDLDVYYVIRHVKNTLEEKICKALEYK